MALTQMATPTEVSLRSKEQDAAALLEAQVRTEFFVFGGCHHAFE